MSVSYCTGLRNCETSLSELLCTSFDLTHCTSQTSENIPSRRCCALCPFCKGACAGCCARRFSPWLMSSLQGPTSPSTALVLLGRGGLEPRKTYRLPSVTLQPLLSPAESCWIMMNDCDLRTGCAGCAESRTMFRMVERSRLLTFCKLQIVVYTAHRFVEQLCSIDEALLLGKLVACDMVH